MASYKENQFMFSTACKSLDLPSLPIPNHFLCELQSTISCGKKKKTNIVCSIDFRLEDTEEEKKNVNLPFHGCSQSWILCSSNQNSIICHLEYNVKQYTTVYQISWRNAHCLKLMNPYKYVYRKKKVASWKLKTNFMGENYVKFIHCW